MPSAPANAETGPPGEDLWRLVRARPQIGPQQLAGAVQETAGQEPLDYRTRLLIRDSLLALESHWGTEKFTAWLTASPAAAYSSRAV